MRLEGKVAVVTGAASGIGLGIATRFAAEGASVVAGDWNAERLDAAVASIKESGGTIVGAEGDISDQATAENLIELALSEYGRLDVLVNNAGVMDYMAGVGELEDDIYRRVMGINVDGPVFTSRRAVRQMLEQGSGSIINIASTAGISGGAAGAVYTISKHAVVGLTRNTAWMYAQRGIRCNAICPGGTMTNIVETMPRERLNPEGAQRAQAFAALMPGYLEPSDHAAIALFLASDEARNINGAIIPADAGWMAL
jgi:NAD(P)-dependent dehydrogenase (short-subunit alcohol dehydrogenase family)